MSNVTQFPTTAKLQAIPVLRITPGAEKEIRYMPEPATGNPYLGMPGNEQPATEPKAPKAPKAKPTRVTALELMLIFLTGPVGLLIASPFNALLLWFVAGSFAMSGFAIALPVAWLIGPILGGNAITKRRQNA